MAVADYLLWTAQVLGVNLWSILPKSAPTTVSDQRVTAEAVVSAREQIARFYQARLEQLEGDRSLLSLAHGREMRLTLAWGFTVAAWLFLSLALRIFPLWSAALAALPLVPAILHFAKASRCKRHEEEILRLLEHYGRRLARVRQEWIGNGDPGMDLRIPGHLAAQDLDLFGDGSLFELLCDVDTPAGRETLAGWLQNPASRQEAVSRQQSIGSLRDRGDLRESLALLREGQASEYSWRILREWLMADPVPVPEWARPAARVVPLGLALACAAWLIGLVHAPAALWLVGAVALVEILLALLLRRRVRSILAEMGLPVRKVESMRQLCAWVRGARLESARLVHLQAELDGASERTRKLCRLVRLLSFRDMDWTVWPFLLMMGTTRTALGIERWRQQHGREMVKWIDVLGEFEALMAIAAYAYEHPDDTFPEFTDEGPLFEAREMGHPLLDPESCVRNDIALGTETRFLLVTGSNMSGKSTLLRAVGLNATLAWTGAPVCALQLRLSPLRVGASIRVEDSLLDGASHFYAEVQRLKAIVDLGKSCSPVLFLIDELFAGTNSADRRVAAEAVIRSLVKQQAIGLVTSHDMALSEIGEMKELKGVNVHFSDSSTADGLLKFDYRVHPGKLARGNALKIIRLVGLLPG